ncbi:hypothetical protein N9J72_02955 [Candidatus Gracilibacteria bacterium]|nr:hypothetical protein [Candidatus Gracilibacteria bacterium]
MEIIMLTQEQIQKFQNDGFSFEEIEDIKKGLQEIKNGETIPEEQFWNEVYADINAKMKADEENACRVS